MPRAGLNRTMVDAEVMTVTGRVAAATLGVVDAHDHLFMRSAAMPGEEFEDLDLSTAEVVEARTSGIGAIVELTPIGLGRRPDLMRAVSVATGVPVIAATGYHRDAHYPAGHWVLEASVAELAERIVRDLEDGMHPHDWTDATSALDPSRAGVIKAGASYHHASAAERRRLAAAAMGSRRGGVAIVVHTEIGTFGHEILSLLEADGVAADRIVLAHLDRNPDAELHAEIASRGVMIEYDTMGRTKYRPDSDLLDLIERMVDFGHLDRLLVGLDLGRRDYFRAYGGGPGMRYLMETFVRRLRRRIGNDAVEAILVANPARTFALRAAEAPG
jgi:5-phospho-D-xylono-1,4-lactonase